MLGTAPDVVDVLPTVGRVALLLARDGTSGLPSALGLLVEAAGLRSAVLRRCGGADELLAVAGDVVHAVPPRRGTHPVGVVELPVRGPGGAELATLTLQGARPAALPALRDAAAVLGLALAAGVVVPPSLAAVLHDREDERTALADALHDGPVQDLVAARFAVDLALRSGDATHAREAVQGALVGLRRLMWQLRPRGADGLGDALTRLSAALVDAGRPGLALDVDPSADVLDRDAATGVYRLVQCLADARPDRGAGPLVVRLAREPAPGGRALVVLTVEGVLPDDLPDGPAADPRGRWRRTAVALGGDLVATRGRVRLLLPAPAARHDPLDPPAPAPPAGSGPAPTVKAVP